MFSCEIVVRQTGFTGRISDRGIWGERGGGLEAGEVCFVLLYEKGVGGMVWAWGDVI